MFLVLNINIIKLKKNLPQHFTIYHRKQILELLNRAFGGNFLLLDKSVSNQRGTSLVLNFIIHNLLFENNMNIHLRVIMEN